MNRYWIDQPCSYAVDGRATMHVRTGAIVELDDETAGALGDAVRLINEAPAEVWPDGKNPLLTDDSPIAENPAAVVESSTADPEGLLDTKPKRTRRSPEDPE